MARLYGQSTGFGLADLECESASNYFCRWRPFYCAPEGIRTPNLLIRSQMLYPLSYGRRSIKLCVRRTGRWRRREDLNLRSP